MFGLGEIQNGIEKKQPGELQTVLKEKFSDLNEGMEEFIKLLDKNNDAKSVQRIIAQYHESKIQAYFTEKGYPQTQDELNRFISHFPTLAKKEVILDNQSQYQKAMEYIQSLKGKIVWEQIKVSSENTPKVQFLKEVIEEGKLQDGNMDKTVSSFYTSLSELSQDEFDSFSYQIRKTSPEAYEYIKVQAIQSSSQSTILQQKFQLFEARNPIKIADISQVSQVERERITLAVGTNPRVEGNLLIKEEGGKQITYDVVTGNRYINIPGSQYMMTSDVPRNEFLTLQKKYQPEISQKQSEIHLFTSIIEQIKKFETSEDIQIFIKNLRQTKREIYQYLKEQGMFVEDKSEILLKKTKQEIISEIQTRTQKITNELEEIKKRYEDEIKATRLKSKQELEAKDARLKEVLSFFHSIGFDILPKSITDTIIELVNAKIPGEIAGIKFDTDINIKEGILGLRDRSAGKELFIQFFHKILGGDEKHPLFKTNGVGKIIGVYVDNESRSDDVSGKIKDLVRNIGRNFTLETAKSNLGL